MIDTIVHNVYLSRRLVVLGIGAPHEDGAALKVVAVAAVTRSSSHSESGQKEQYGAGQLEGAASSAAEALTVDWLGQMRIPDDSGKQY